jgi:membrane protease YdiL (CAAX protease family)
MSTFDYLVVAAGLVAQMLAWRSVSRGKREVLSVVPFVLAAMGLVAIVLYPDTTAKVSAGKAALVGAVSGVVFWGATRLFVIVADRWAFFRKAVAAAYGQASDTPLARELLLSLLLAVPGEELFWRGFTQQSLTLTGIGAAGAALVAWVLYVVGNLPSRSLPIITAAVVAGFLWGVLGWWSAGVVAPLASHILWTGLMLALPPKAAGPVESA